jgi:tRNA threonylcarbamoyl adenosine modification protein YjeE
MTGSVTVTCADEAATRALAARLATLVRPGDVLLLEGDLGAGKTTFTQAMATALGVTSAVTSPTFTLMNIYRTTPGYDLVHVDAYRLDRLSEVVDLALPEMLDEGAAVVVEWGERAAAALPGDQLRVLIGPGEGEGGRIVELVPVGARWSDLEARI